MVAKSTASDRLRTQSDMERDADGRSRQSEEDNRSLTPMTDEEFQKAFQVLKALPALNQHDFRFRVEKQDQWRVIFIEDPKGKVIRRIMENEIYFLLQSKDCQTGQIYNRKL